ncbi:uncharacterized protein NESG_01178 [Nematocida ausubeli]|uniref:Uncharacterized protein n=1 Tax=Nematocida ausubeli (strain ATCC PRA-371 / ERTm2) TaxID=1913371 RepID=A0A086J1P7_NEMA1|nr:uncharacterized protein NESG_01178 [Nematocida ausubeli]KAI5138211.1 hypothetical protein NEAUS06_2451 [Nematocida ausubeli]KAI5138592.1 hypothetical protein NEAUS07_2379 [Nematocida ausubeli]KAI5151156.1 hypothetical protein NEAUS05_2422 [Nematocida ausubeli]KFG26065.1 hypothetical protein NESG_01178 [Nematocida ausubeli]
MKQQIYIAGVILAILQCYYAQDVEHDEGLYVTAANPVTPPLKITESKKKKNVRLDNHGYIGALLQKAGVFLRNTLLSSFSPITSKAYSKDYPEYTPLVDKKSSSTNKQIKNSENPLKSTDKLLVPSKPKQTIKPIGKVTETHPPFIPYTGDVAEVVYSPNAPRKMSSLEDGFYKNFKAHIEEIPDKERFVKKGIQNAKKNLMQQARLARAYTSAAAEETMGVLDNTMRSSSLLSDLIKKGLVTPASAAQELADSVKDVATDYLDASSRNMKGAANYLLHTSVGSVDGIIDNLKYSPSAMSSLISSYKSLLTNPRFNLSVHIPSLAVSLEMDMYRLTKFVHPPPFVSMGYILAEMNKNVNSLKGEWDIIERSLFGHENDYFRKKFLEMTKDLATVLDSLSVRLGKDIKLSMPGVDALRFRFKTILDEIKKKNHLTMSGELDLKELLDYSMGISSQLHDIDRAILSLGEPSQHTSGHYLAERGNPLKDLTGFDNIRRRILSEQDGSYKLRKL